MNRIDQAIHEAAEAVTEVVDGDPGDENDFRRAPETPAMPAGTGRASSSTVTPELSVDELIAGLTEHRTNDCY